MNVNEFEKKLKEIKLVKVPEIICENILKYSEEMISRDDEIIWDIPPVVIKMFYTILGSMPFVELFWLINEKFIKKNEIKFKLY